MHHPESGLQGIFQKFRSRLAPVNGVSALQRSGAAGWRLSVHRTTCLRGLCRLELHFRCCCDAQAMVAVGTPIAERPPHRSRRALLTHRAPPSGRTSAVGGLKPHAPRRTAANRIDVASRLSVRTTAACRLFPLGEALPSTTSAGSYLPLFGRFLGTTTSSDFSSAYMLGVRLLPSRAGPARVRARVRPPRFRAKNFSTCTRSPTARGSSHASHLPWDDVAFSSAA
jgi:hypothetical protein